MSAQQQSKRDPAHNERATSIDDRGRSTAKSDGDLAVFRNLVEAAQCMIVILHPDRTIAYFNAFAEQLTGYSSDAIVGKDYLDVLVRDTARPGVEACFRQVLAGTSIGEIEHPLVAKAGTIRWVVGSFRSFGEYRGKPAVLLTGQDITVHNHTEETLRRRTHDLGERIKELNCLFGLSKLVEELGTDLEGIIQRLVDILPPGWQYPEVTCGRVVFEGREFTTYNFRETEWKQTAPISVHGKVVGTIEVYYLDEKPRMHEGPFLMEERRLLNALAKQLGRIAERRNLEKEISEISTREQQRIGQELHDGLGQELTGLGYLAETLYCDLKSREAAEMEMANQLADGIERALEQARTIAKGLVPVELDAGGLISALDQLTANTEHRCGIACRLHCDRPAPVADTDTATATQLFRIVQEAINNAVKHAAAQRIDVELRTDDRQIALEVRDDGKGIADDLEHAPGMGLHIMQYRAGVIGAVLSVQPAAGGGTMVTCLLPRGGH